MNDSMTSAGVGVQGALKFPSVGTLVDGRLRVLGVMGVGSTSTVMRAWDEFARRSVALKFVSAENHDNISTLVLAEFNALQNVRHASLPEVYGVSVGSYGSYLELECLESQSLSKRIESCKYDTQTILQILDDVSWALDALHAAGYAHRDVKPENVLFRGTRGVLVDLGLAVHTDDLQTKEVGSPGTPAYLAPEVLDGKVSSLYSWQRVDRYAFAVMTYLCLSGVLPFDADTRLGAIYARALHDATPISRHRVQLPPSLDGVMARALSRVPSERYPTASAFSRALERAFATMS